MTHSRQCCDCGYRWTVTTAEPWLDPMICVRCGSDESVGDAGLTLEQELRQITEGRFEAALGEGRR
jgi:hypothetical protein